MRKLLISLVSKEINIKAMKYDFSAIKRAKI